MNHVVNVLANSGVHLGAHAFVRTFCWNYNQELMSVKVEYHDRKRMKWLVDWSIGELRKYQTDGNELPGKSIHGGGDNKPNEILAGAVDKLVDNNGKLTDNNGVLTNNNGVLTNTCAKQADHIISLTSELKEKEKQIEAYKAAANPRVEEQQEVHGQGVNQVLVTPRPTKSKSAAANTASRRSTRKKKKKTTVADNWDDGEDVQVLENYSIKKYAGKVGIVSLSASTDDMVMVVFDNGASSKLIDRNGLKSLCY